MDKISLNTYQQTLKNRAAAQPKGIHSYSHSIVKEVCDWLGSNKEFGLWLGVAKRITPSELKVKLDYVKERGIRDPKYLLASCRK